MHGVQPSVVLEKLNVVTNRGRRKLSMIVLNNDLFFLEKKGLDFGQLWANLDPIFIKYRVVSLIDHLLVVF